MALFIDGIDLNEMHPPGALGDVTDKTYAELDRNQLLDVIAVYINRSMLDRHSEESIYGYYGKDGWEKRVSEEWTKKELKEKEKK